MHHSYALMLTWRMCMAGEPKTQLVVIGDKVDAAGMQEALLRCQQPDSQHPHEATSKAEHASSGALGGALGAVGGGWPETFQAIRSDPNFEVWSAEEAEEQEEAASGVGAPRYAMLGLQETDEMRLHGVYARNLNAEVVSAVNAERASLLLLPVRPPGNNNNTLMMLCSKVAADAGGTEDASDLARWEIVQQTAYRVLESKCIARCKCGF